MRRLAFVLALVAVGGCSVVNDPDRHTSGIPADELCGEMAELACGARNDCCPLGPVPDLEECMDNARSACESGLEPIFTEEKAGYSPARAAEVIDRGRALAADCDPAIAEWYVYDVISVMRGTASSTQNCTPTSEDDSASFFSCKVDDDLVCRPVEGFAGPWECQGISPAGGECAIIQHCERDAQLYCEIPFAGSIGSCERRKSNGTACTEAVECRSFFCDRSGTCASLDETVYCVPLETFYGDDMDG